MDNNYYKWVIMQYKPIKHLFIAYFHKTMN